MTRLFCVASMATVIGSSGFAALPPATPESQGVSSEAVLRWIDACEATAATNGFRRGYVHGFVVVRHGKTIAEGSWAPQDTLNAPHMLYSHSKSFTSTAIGFLVDDGKLDLDERVIAIFPDKAPVVPSENLRQLRVRDLLTMNVGADRTDAENDDVRGDWVRAFLANEIQRTPGTGFRYDSGATHLLAAIVERKTGLKLMDFLGERLFRPLGMTSPWSTVSPTGVACGGWGMNMTTRDLATFGQFLLQQGRWNGTQLLSREWIALATGRQTWSGGIVVQAQTIGSGSDWAQGYGFQFWRCRHGAYRADGASGQLTVVFPKEDAVVSVHAGLGDMQRELDLIWQYLLPAFGSDALPENESARTRLAAKCRSLALPLADSHPATFEGMDKATVERTADGWDLVSGDRRLAVGDGTWKTTDWKYTDDHVEPLFASCGTWKIAANGVQGTNGTLVVSWQMLGGIRHGTFMVRTGTGFHGTASSVTVDFKAGNDGAIRFAANDLTRILKGVPGKVALKVDPAMDAEVWRFATAADGTFEIWGRDGMGIAYGVYTYLERHCGVSWLAPDTEVVPDFTGFKLPKPNGEGRPAFSYREMWQSDLMDPTWRLRNKESRRALYGVGIGMGSPRDNHTFDNYCRTLRKTHPEIFDNGRPDANGKTCLTLCMTDPRAQELVAEEMCRYIAQDRKETVGKPRYLTPVVYDLSQSDGSGGQCMCPGCKAVVDAAGGTYAAANLMFVNAVAEKVGRKYPDVVIQTFAYGHTEKPPANDVRYADNVNVRYCRSWIFRPLSPTSENGQMLKEWAKHGSSFGIWSYWSTCRGSAFPLVQPPKVIEEELRFCRDCGVKRYFLQTDAAFESSFMFLKNWMFLKLAEDPDQDSAALTAKFMKGLYGPAERPMSAYLAYLISRQEPTRAFLDRDFFEKVNAWLDEAERLAKNDERALRHVRNERVVVDRSMYENLAKLQRAGYRYDKAEVARRFAANAHDQIVRFAVNAKMRDAALARVDGEAKLYAHFPVEVPKRFAGLEVEDLHWNRCKGQRSAVVEDPDACAGMAFYNNVDPVHSLPFSCGYYHQEAKYGDGISFQTRADVPQDEKFHLYRLGRGKVYNGLYLNYDRYWENRYYTSTPGIIPEEWEIWVSMKFQGPDFVAGSTKENRVLFDRLLYVKNDDPMRGYRVVGPDLVKNARPVEVTGIAKGLKFVHFEIGDVASVTNDLYVSGQTRIKGIDGGKGMGDPFGGLWALAPGGKNAFMIECANYVKGDSDWYRFDRVIEANRLRVAAAAYKEPLKLYFRVNLLNQPGTVFLKDLKVVPVAPWRIGAL